MRTSSCLSALPASLSDPLIAGLELSAWGFSTLQGNLSLGYPVQFTLHNSTSANRTNLLIGIYAGESAGMAGMATLTCNLLGLRWGVSRADSPILLYLYLLLRSVGKVDRALVFAARHVCEVRWVSFLTDQLTCMQIWVWALWWIFQRILMYYSRNYMLLLPEIFGWCHYN